jgi:hypothetical protein
LGGGVRARARARARVRVRVRVRVRAAPARSTGLPAQAIQRRALAKHWGENQLGARA